MNTTPNRTALISTGDRIAKRDCSGEIAGLLLSQGYITQEQLDYAVRVQSKLEAYRPLLLVIKELNFVSDEQIKQALRAKPLSIRIGRLLVELGHIREEDLEFALRVQDEETAKRKLGEILLEHHLVDEHVLLETLSLQLNLPAVEPECSSVDRKLFSRVPVKWYDSHRLLPLQAEGSDVPVAFVDPLNKEDIEAARQVFGRNIRVTIASRSAVQDVVLKLQRGEVKRTASVTDEQSVVSLTDSIILAAIERGASDIHIEPLKDRVRVRFRQDGVLNHFEEYPREIAAPLTSRLKVLCDVDITEKRRHQGGRFSYEHAEGQVDLRSSFYVTVNGEATVLRLPKRHGQLRKIEDIGLPARMLERFLEEALDLPSGVLVFTGPTGSGKTTTVYSCLKRLTNSQTSIITAEDPVEYVINGISQCSINPEINVTYEETLRHILRQDPDVIVIGEIRDNFSAEVALQAALTGHKVLTTFHTEDTIGGLIRLLNMNIEAFMISSTLVSIMAQRLLRKTCPVCKELYKPSSRELQRIGYGSREILGVEFCRGRGCAHCQHTGHKGRVGVFELLILDEAVRHAVLERSSSQQLRRLGIESAGMITLLEDGIIKASDGITSIDEILRCLPRLQAPRPLPELRRLTGG
jgi:type IV pilus assembly protein PilB